jgi:UDP-N-acetyl-2-amino-2-deoxyglucuronate dehydrogenase
VNASQRRRVAIIGLGNVAESHILAYKKLECVDVVAVAEPRSERRAEIVNRYGLRGYADAEALLANEKPDIACILTPARTHRALTESLARAGCHILCEKPMAVTLEDALAMKSACDAAEVQFYYGASYRHLPALQRARFLIGDGAIGVVRLIVEQLIGGEGAAAFRPLSSEHYPEGGPGGGGYGMMDHGIHLFDVMPWLCGSPVTWVFGSGDRTGVAPKPEFAFLQMASGASGVVSYFGSTYPTDLPWEGVFNAGKHWVDGRGWIGDEGSWDQGAASIRVYGTQGSLRIFHYANKLFHISDAGLHECAVAGHHAPWHFGAQMRSCCESLSGNNPPAASGEDGIAALRVMHALYASEKSGCRQNV